MFNMTYQVRLFEKLFVSIFLTSILWGMAKVSYAESLLPSDGSSGTKSSVKALWHVLQEPSLPPLSPANYLPEPFSNRVSQLVIDLSERRVYVYGYNSDAPLKSYPIAVGKQGWETPVGTFEVLQMLQNPAWEHPWTGEIVPPGAGNPLGDRWIGFWTDGLNYIGFHGTPAEELVGQAVSHGCIRMRNADVRDLFALVTVGTPVLVEP